jgi:hypothetical protein
MTEIPSASFLAVFRAHADANGAMPFDRFMELALYDPAVGYYRREQSRVGYEAGTDFFTASTSGPVFGELVAAAGAALVRAQGGAPGDFVFVEIGAEPAAGVLAGVTHPFGAVRTVRVGEPIELKRTLPRIFQRALRRPALPAFRPARRDLAGTRRD